MQKLLTFIKQNINAFENPLIDTIFNEFVINKPVKLTML